MAILIEDMKMPKEIDILFIYPSEKVFVRAGKDLTVEQYEAIEIPPHGRLGDLDELAKRIEHERYNHTHTDGLAARHHIAEYGHFLNAIAAAPTIISASEEE